MQIIALSKEVCLYQHQNQWTAKPAVSKWCLQFWCYVSI